MQHGVIEGKRLKIRTEENWGWPHQRHPGTRVHRCGCSLPGLTGFTVYRCGGTGRTTIMAVRIARTRRE